MYESFYVSYEYDVMCVFHPSQDEVFIIHMINNHTKDKRHGMPFDPFCQRTRQFDPTQDGLCTRVKMS